MLEAAVVVKVTEGLHARPATQFAKLAKQFSCSLQVLHGHTCADAKSAVKLMLLGIREHDQIVLRADGADERAAVARMLAFLSEPAAGVTPTSAAAADAPAMLHSVAPHVQVAAPHAAAGTDAAEVPAARSVAVAAANVVTVVPAAPTADASSTATPAAAATDPTAKFDTAIPPATSAAFPASVVTVLAQAASGAVTVFAAASTHSPSSRSALGLHAAAPAVAQALQGVPASEGLAYGDAFVYLPEPLRATRQRIAAHETGAELARFERAFADALAALGQPFESIGGNEDIAQALAGVAQSDEFAGAVRTRIAAGSDAAAATLQVGAELAASFDTIEDEYLRSRADDIHGITRQVALRLLGKDNVSLAGLSRPCVVLAADLTAPDLARANVANIVALVCTRGSTTSHLAIIARSHGIPAVFGLPVPDERLRSAHQVAVDGAQGLVWFDPPHTLQAEFAARIAEVRAQHSTLHVYRDVAPVTRSGRPIRVAANLGSLGEIDAARTAGAMGVGLFRTELLFMDRRALPSEDEQYDVYRRVAQAFDPEPVVIRTLDVGGDKPVPGIAFPSEDNPFLGWRGVRMCLDRPDIFKPQLRALLRASVAGNLQMMLPMIDELDEIRCVKALIAQCAEELTGEGVAFDLPRLGIMIETPAAALTADLLAPEVDFFSIGTNDLTQYVMAVDRANPKLAPLYRTDHPAVLRAIAMVCDAAHKAGIGVAVCGEAAAQPALIPLLLGLGVDELSMSPAAILRAKKLVSEC